MDRIQLLIDNPRKAMAHTWGREPEVFDKLLVRALALIDSDPHAGLASVKTILRHAPTACQRVQGYGMWAQIHRATGELDVADKALKDAFFHGEECPECVADLHRRRATLQRNRLDFDAALDDATEAIRRYQELGHAGHDLYSNGLASSYNVRAVIRFYMKDYAAAAADEREALALLDPKQSPALYRIVIFNLANALQHTGNCADLLESEKYLSKARKLFSGVREGSQERAKLDWVTAQVRYQLEKGQPCRLRKDIERAIADFLKLGMVLEAVAAASDLMKMKLARQWGAGTPRDVIREIFEDLVERLPTVSAKLMAALDALSDAVDAYGWDAETQLQAAIDRLRKTCGAEMVACLVTWK